MSETDPEIESRLSNSVLNCLVQLALKGNVSFPVFCKEVVASGHFKSSQSVRNVIGYFITKNIIVKNDKREITLNIPELTVESPAIVTIYLGHA